MPRSRIESLGKRVRALQSAFRDFEKASKDLEVLWDHIHNPGWTTPADWAFVQGIITAELNLAQNTLELNNALLQGAKKVEITG